MCRWSKVLLHRQCLGNLKQSEHRKSSDRVYNKIEKPKRRNTRQVNQRWHSCACHDVPSLAGVVSGQVERPTWSNLMATTYGSETMALTLFLQDTDAGDVLVLGNMCLTVVEPLPTAGNLSAQECGSMTYLQTNGVDCTGTWWNSWYEVEGCHWCGKRGQGGSGSCPFSKSLSISQTWSFNAGFNAGGTQAAKDAINKIGALNLGFSWEKSKTKTFTYGCTVPQGDIASI